VLLAADKHIRTSMRRESSSMRYEERVLV
jgi:hypothetical protein